MLARDRTLPVTATLAELLPDRALVRGQTIACSGPAGPSLAFALTAAAVTAGSWIAAIDTPWVNTDALVELGVPVERVVRIDSGGDPRRWAELTAAAAVGGFELLVVDPPPFTPTLQRRLRATLRDAVLIAVRAPNGLAADLTLATTKPVWEQAGRLSDGHLAARRVELAVTARRHPRGQRAMIWLPDRRGHITFAVPTPGELLCPDDDPDSITATVATVATLDPTPIAAERTA